MRRRGHRMWYATPAFDAAATAKIEEAVDQAVTLARSEEANGTDPRTRALAAAVLAARTAVSSR